MQNSTVTCYDFGQFRLHLKNRRLLKNGEDVYLSQKSLDILLILLKIVKEW